MRWMRVAASAALLLPAGLAAQESGTRCNAINTDSTRETDIKVAPNVYNAFFGGGVIVVCPSRKLRLKADSAEQYGADRRLYLIGHVFYQEPRFTLHSDLLNYFMNDERIVATGNVDATLPSGSRLTGPMATYLRPIPKTRPLADLTAVGRPTISLVQQDSAGHPTPPMKVTADQVHMSGDSLVYAGGKVELVRQDLTAHADSMFLDGRQNVMHLLRGPRIEGTKGTHPFTLVGTLLDLYSSNQKLKRVLARGAAVATSTNLRLAADTIDLRVNNDVLDRAIAWGRPRHATARSPSDSLRADSIDVLMPNQRAREIHAVGTAYAESTPDTVKFRTTDKDWMRGDTILAMFDTIPPRDTTQAPRVRQLIAIDSAKAYYNMAPRDTTLCVPAVSYSLGHRIVVTFDDKGVKRVDVEGKTYGLLVEPTDSLPANRCAKPARKPDGGVPHAAARDSSMHIHRPESR